MDFTKSIFENRFSRSTPLLAAHRGICGANIPCNTIAAYKIAIDQGADVVELDVSRTIDGKFFAFHPGMEPAFLKCGDYIKNMRASRVEKLFLLNQDEVKTSYKIPTLAEALDFLKGKAYINVDKFWIDIPGITEEIRRAGVADQVIVKTSTDPSYLEQVKEYAPDFMFIPLVNEKDEVTDWLIEQGVNVIFVESMPSIAFLEKDQPELEALSAKHASLLCGSFNDAVSAVTTKVKLTVSSKFKYVYVSPYEKDGTEFFFLACNAQKDIEIKLSYPDAVGYRIYDPVSGEIYEVDNTVTIKSFRALFVQPLLAES